MEGGSLGSLLRWLSAIECCDWEKIPLLLDGKWQPCSSCHVCICVFSQGIWKSWSCLWPEGLTSRAKTRRVTHCCTQQRPVARLKLWNTCWGLELRQVLWQHPFRQFCGAARLVMILAMLFKNFHHHTYVHADVVSGWLAFACVWLQK